MPASTARIAFVGQQFRSVVASDSAIKTRYGPSARDTADEPVETFFDSTNDAQAVVNERLTLLKGDRRKFNVSVARVLDFSGGLSFLQTVPTATLIDREKSANFSVGIVGIPSLDLETEATSLSVWG